MGGRHLFFPIALFAGQIFAVTYQGKLIVREVPFLEYYVEFNKEPYRREPENPSREPFPLWAGLEKWTLNNRKEKIRNIARELALPYQIDFVTEAGFPDYLSLVEKEVSALHISDWAIPEPDKSGL